jgi:RNA polymerase sigma-70 factor (ECF subfamily)
MARHQLQRRLARERAYVPLPYHEADEPAESGDPDADPLAGLTQRERVERVRVAVRSLPLPYREALVLCDLQGLSYEEAAQALECSTGTIRSRLHRARGLLVAKLEAEREAPARAAMARR